MPREHPAVADELAPRVFRPLRRGRIAPRADYRFRLGMRQQEQALLVEFERVRQPCQQRQRRAAPAVFKIRDVARFHPELACEFSLGKRVCFAALFEDLSKSFFFHSLIPPVVPSQFCRVIHRGNLIR